MKVVRYRGSDEWSALYVDGKLDVVGDHYLTDDRIASLLGVEEIHSDDFMRGGNDRDSVPLTVEGVYQYTSDRQERVNRAEKLKTQAAALLREAEELENKK